MVPGPSAAQQPSFDELRSFSPTIVLNFAFLTRERVQVEGPTAFRSTNEQLTARFLRIAQLPTVRAAVTVSSGAAITEPESLYGMMKKDEESRALHIVSDRRAMVILRAYSVSGGYVRRPRDYAFSDFIMQAREGSIHVNAGTLVRRRYCAVRDALTVSLRAVTSGASGVIESGGDLVEVGELADQVAAVVNPSAGIDRPHVDTSRSQNYYSDNSSWKTWTREFAVTPIDLETQIRETAQFLHGGH